MKIGEKMHFRWLFGIIATVLVLNLLDAVFTLMWYVNGAATEANPFMDALLSKGSIPFVVGKSTLVFGGSFLLWRRRQHAFSVVAIVVLFLVYYFLLLYHLKAMNIQLIKRFLG